MPYIGKITDTSGSTGLIGSTLYGTCTTDANTAAKVGTLSDFDTLITGVTIHIKFTNTNTATNPTLNVNNTGAKSIYKAGTTAVGTTVGTSWAAGAVVSFTYDGTAWLMNDHVDDTNTTYSAGTGLTLSGTTFNHSATISTDTTSSESPTHGGTFTVVDSVTRDSTGHVTTLNTKSITLPSDQNTDTKVNVKLATTTKAYLLATSTTPTSSNQAVESVADTGVYLDTTAGKLTTGSLQSNGNVTLYSASGDSPSLIFQRGTLIDNLNDWKIYVSGGGLYFAKSTANASSETWTNKMYFHASDGNLYVSGTKVSLNGHTHTEYVQKTGDSMSGALSIAYTAFGALTLERKNAVTAAAIYFKNSNGVLGAIGMTETVNSGLYRWSADTNSRYKILDTGNTSFTQTLTSGTKIGSIKINDTSTDIYCSDTKNTAGSTDTSSKIYLIGATSQAANPQTYSDNEVYTTSGVLTTKSVQVGGGACTMQYNTTTQSLDFVFA